VRVRIQHLARAESVAAVLSINLKENSMRTETQLVIKAWFDGLNRTDIDGLLSLFAPSPIIRNAANPPMEGPEAARRLLEDFFHRTTARRFDVTDSAEGDGQVFACWQGTLTFAAGTMIADVLLEQPMTVPLRGVERFRLDQQGRISELDIVHETSSILQAARAANNK
jgi:hypothetical protein